MSEKYGVFDQAYVRHALVVADPGETQFIQNLGEIEYLGKHQGLFAAIHTLWYEDISKGLASTRSSTPNTRQLPKIPLAEKLAELGEDGIGMMAALNGLRDAIEKLSGRELRWAQSRRNETWTDSGYIVGSIISFDGVVGPPPEVFIKIADSPEWQNGMGYSLLEMFNISITPRGIV